MTFLEQIAIVLMIVVFSIFHCVRIGRGATPTKKRKCKKGSFVINKVEKKDDVK